MFLETVMEERLRVRRFAPSGPGACVFNEFIYVVEVIVDYERQAIYTANSSM